MSDPTGFEKIVVSDSPDGSLRIQTSADSKLPTIRNVGDQGWGDDLKMPAWGEIREYLDPADYEPGEHIATIQYDLAAWEYQIEYQVDPPSVSDRLRSLLRLFR